MSDSFYELLNRAFVKHADRPCLIVPDGTCWSYGDIGRLAGKIAGVLIDHGVSPGDRVLVQVEKSPEAVGLYLGCLQVGGVYVPINSAYTIEEVAYFVEDAQPGLFVCRGRDEAALRLIAPNLAILSLGADGTGSLMGFVAATEALDEVVPRDASDTAAILYTSGTTGRSKGAMLTNDNLASNALTLADYWGWRDDDVLLHALPIFHVHGLFVALHCAMLRGTAMIFLPGFDAREVIRQLPAATVMMGVPTFYTRLLENEDFSSEVCRNMRLFISGSAPLTEQTFEAWQARTGHLILERYGMSETFMNTSNPLDGQRVAGTVGFALPGIEVRITDDAGEVLPTGEVGGIEVRGPNVFKGYWRMPKKTAEEIREDGFFITGDMGVMDAEGRVSIVGRAKDMVISGGYNIYPKEVEKLIDEMPGVVESAVIGVPHADFGEGVVAVVVPQGEEVSEPEVRSSLEGRLARFKQPKIVVNVASLPRNTMGKVQKNALRKQFNDLFDSGR
ncbi:MAG: malonyl-CoA synthase [Gammaproteobacteria bacterium]|nr:malonyl-CoA synthase [Gammaproteobacteria bacterium]